MRSLIIASLLCSPVLLCAMATPTVAEEDKWTPDKTNTESIKKRYKINVTRLHTIKKEWGDPYRRYDHPTEASYILFYRQRGIRDPNTGETYNEVGFYFKGFKYIGVSFYDRDYNP